VGGFCKIMNEFSKIPEIIYFSID
ncbi:uncharacterized protein METZ01_LOCUS341451, partial [marine metagenome]